MLKFRIIMAKNYKYYKYVYKQKYRIILKSSSVVEHHLLYKSNDNTILNKIIFSSRDILSLLFYHSYSTDSDIDYIFKTQVLYDPKLTGSNK